MIFFGGVCVGGGGEEEEGGGYDLLCCVSGGDQGVGQQQPVRHVTSAMQVGVVLVMSVEASKNSSRPAGFYGWLSVTWVAMGSAVAQW